MTLRRIRALLLDARTLLVPGPHEGCACDTCAPLWDQRRELRQDLDEAIADVDAEIAHQHAVALVGCRFPDCSLCSRQSAANGPPLHDELNPGARGAEGSNALLRDSDAIQSHVNPGNTCIQDATASWLQAPDGFAICTDTETIADIRAAKCPTCLDPIVGGECNCDRMVAP